MKRLALSVLLSFSCSFSFADVTVKSISKSGGFQGMGAHEGSSLRMLQGNKMREDSDFKFSGKMMKFMTGGDKSGAHIVRVDLDKIWRLNLKKKTYTETAISAVKEKAAKTTEPDQPAAEPSDEKPTHRIKKTDFTVKKTGAKKTINGFNTEETEARMLVDIEEIASGEVTSYVMVTNFWMTPLTSDLKRALDEEVKFQKAYFTKMGLTFSPKDQEIFGGAALKMMLGLGDKNTGDLLAKLKDKTKDLNGYPIVTESEWTVKEDPKAVQRRKDEQAKADSDDSPEVSADPKAMAGNLLGSFAKKKMKQRQEAKEKEREGKPQFSAYHEVVSVSVAGVDAATFDVPAGFKKVK